MKLNAAEPLNFIHLSFFFLLTLFKVLNKKKKKLSFESVQIGPHKDGQVSLMAAGVISPRIHWDFHSLSSAEFQENPPKNQHACPPSVCAAEREGSPVMSRCHRLH